MTAPARLAALRVLRDVHTGRHNLPTSQALSRAALTDPRDRALATEIVLGTLRWRAQVDHVIQLGSSRPLHRIDTDVLDVLRLSTYQLLHLKRVPARAVVHDGVELTRALGAKGKHSAATYVNAVLRFVAKKVKNGDSLGLPQPSQPSRSGQRDRETDLEYLSVSMSHPRWLVARWYDRYGFDVTEQWTRFDNGPAPITLRVNTLATSTPELAEKLLECGVSVEAGAWAPHSLVVTRGNPLTTDLHDRRLFWVQDQASQLVAGLVDADPGDRVLDACAAPGGKSLVIAGAMGDQGLLVASDQSAARIRLLSETLARVGPRCASIVQLDARRPPFGPRFEWVVLDSPCTGLGTLRRDPDIRWRRNPEDLSRMASMQFELLAGASTAVAPGGRLLYATCSSEPDENQNVVTRFLESHPGFSIQAPTAPHLLECVDDEGFLQTRPDRHGLEGFFAAVLRRQAS